MGGHSRSSLLPRLWPRALKGHRDAAQEICDGLAWGLAMKRAGAGDAFLIRKYQKLLMEHCPGDRRGRTFAQLIGAVSTSKYGAMLAIQLHEHCARQELGSNAPCGQ